MTTPATTHPGANDVAERAVLLDTLLIDAALGPLRRFRPDGSTARLATALAGRPLATGRRLAALGSELVRIAIGTDAIAPSGRDGRFSDPAWTTNPLLRRVMQAYLAVGRAAGQLIDDAELESRDAARVRLFADNLVEALAPSNIPLVNPASAKAAIDTGGVSLLRGGRTLLHDLATPPRIPQLVDRSPFQVGRNIASTPGAVVLRTDLLELIQYRPQTEQVRTVPLLIAPPTINKYYALDLAPGRSLVEYLVRSGQQVFMISWRNPDARHRAIGLDGYVQALLEALDAVERIGAVERAALFGFCSGGIIASLAAAHRAGRGERAPLAAFGLGVTVLDFANAGTSGAFVDRRLAERAKAWSRRRGYLDGRNLAEVFAWLRPGDLVWSYWVNNYLLGQKPPAFDILFWNADATRMTAALHADFLDLAIDNRLVSPGAATALGAAIDLGKIDADSYLIAGRADHLTPWQSCYRSTQLLGGASRFVLSSSGHIAALVNPPGNPRAGYQVSSDNPSDSETWLTGAEARPGSWWPDLVEWLAERTGPDRRKPRSLGRGDLRSLIDAPGTYVLDS